MPEPDPNQTSPESADETVRRPSRGRLRRGAVRVILVAGVLTACGAIASCIRVGPTNPNYDASFADVREEMSRMKAEPVELDRPVLVLSGYRSPAGSAFMLKHAIGSLTGEDNSVHSLSYPLEGSIESPASKAVAYIEELYPSDDPEWTTEVDVVAISMGGLVARLAASDPELRDEPGGKRLKIGTLYTLATPHRGAAMSETVRPDKAARDMQEGSRFLAQLNEQLEAADYEIVPYAVLRDGMVGATNTAPHGQEPIWVSGRLFMSHLLIALESRIYTDVALRLRGEEPLGSPSEPPRD